MGEIRKEKLRTLYRDIVRLVKMEIQVVLIALESQDKIHYAMPVRVMAEDSGTYYEQWKKISKLHRKKRDLTGAEFLSGMSSKDKLMPVITIVIYFGKEPWDGPRSIKEMLDLDELPEKVQELINDYPIYILEVRKIKNPEIFKSDFRLVVEFLQREDNKEEIEKYIHENESVFTSLEEDTFDLISTMSSSKQLQNIKMECRNEEGGVDMCRAIQEMIEDGRNEGRNEGIELAVKIMKMNKEGLKKKEISKKCGISISQVRRIIAELVE